MKKILTVLILSVFFLFSCGQTEPPVIQDEIVKKYAQTERVALKNFSEELKLTWKITSSAETTLSSQVSGTIKEIHYKVWDTVKQWEILASIDTKSNGLSTNLNTANNSYNNTVNVFELTKESIAKDLDSAKVQLENAKMTKENTYLSTDQQLKIVQTQLENIKTQVKNTKSSSINILELAEKSYENAKLNLANFETNSKETLNWLEIKMKSLQDKKSGLWDTIESTTHSNLSSIDSALTYVDTVLWVTDGNKNFNDSYELYLSAKNTNFKVEAEDAFKKAKQKYDTVKDSQGTPIEQLHALETLVDTTIRVYEEMVKVWDNSITSSSFTEASLTAIKTTIKANQSLILWIKSGIVSLINTSTDVDNSLFDLENTINSTKINLSTQKSSIEQSVSIALTSLENTKTSIGSTTDSVNGNEDLAKNQLESTLASIKQTRDSVDNAVKIAENQYNSTKAKLDSSLAWIKTQLDWVKWQKNALLQQIENSFIKAPYSGVITWKNIEIWTLVNPGTPVFALSKENTKIVKMDLNGDNIKFVHVGKEVIVSKNGTTCSGVINLVSSSADNLTKMYNIEIKLTQTFFSSVVLWDYVDVYVNKISPESKQYIVIPFTALIPWSTWDFYVYLVGSWEVLKTQMIKIGESNSHEVVVTDWLTVWDTIVTSGTLNLSEWDTIEK